MPFFAAHQPAASRETAQVFCREAIDKYYGDRGRYPDSLDDLVERKYLRRIPADPISDSVRTWVTVPPDEAGKGAVSDVKSGATGTAPDGTHYGDW